MERKDRSPIFLAPGEGRAYSMGSMQALFKADGEESLGKYAISEWWLDAYSKGPGAHSHSEDDIFFVLEGTMSFLVGDEWIDAPRGSFVLAPGGSTHDFENRSAERAGVLNISVPGSFEQHMPQIVSWFAKNPLGSTQPTEEY
ncbi:cupin domain-containing protein [Microbulbifer elongatus]